MDQEIIAKAAAIVEAHSAENTASGQERAVVLGLIDEEGYPTASTITVSHADGIREIWFDTGLGSNKAKRIARCNRACVCLSAQDHNITLVGDIEVSTDPKVKADAWYQGMSNHFKGPEDPDYCVLIFRTRRYNLFVDWKEAVGTL